MSGPTSNAAEDVDRVQGWRFRLWCQRKSDSKVIYSGIDHYPTGILTFTLSV